LTLKSLCFDVVFVDLKCRCGVGFCLLAIAAFEEDLAQRDMSIDQTVVPKDRRFERAHRLFAVDAVAPATPVNLEVDWPVLVTLTPLACLMAAALGLTFGTRFEPRTVPILFGVIVLPLTFLGALTALFLCDPSPENGDLLKLLPPLALMAAARVPGTPGREAQLSRLGRRPTAAGGTPPSTRGRGKGGRPVQGASSYGLDPGRARVHTRASRSPAHRS